MSDPPTPEEILAALAPLADLSRRVDEAAMEIARLREDLAAAGVVKPRPASALD